MATYVIRRRNGDTHTVLLDDEDEELVLAQGRWSYHNQGYAFFNAPGKPRVYMHRLILDVPPGDLVVDHVNGNKLDNRKSNLRLLTRARNVYNQLGINNKGTSQHRGVSWDAARSRWRAETRVDGHRYTLGRFAAEEQAVEAVRRFREDNGLCSY